MWDLLLKDSLFALEQKGKIKDPNTKFKLAQKNSVCVITIKTSWYNSPPVEWAGRGLSPFSGFNFMQKGCVYHSFLLVYPQAQLSFQLYLLFL